MTDDENGEESETPWGLLGLGGVLSLCCIVAAPATTGVAAGATAGSTAAGLGGGVVRVAVAALTAGVVGFALRARL